MINASDKTEPAGSLPTSLHIAAISSTSVFVQISGTILAKVTSIGGFMSFANCNRRMNGRQFLRQVPVKIGEKKLSRN